MNIITIENYCTVGMSTRLKRWISDFQNGVSLEKRILGFTGLTIIINATEGNPYFLHMVNNGIIELNLWFVLV